MVSNFSGLQSMARLLLVPVVVACAATESHADSRNRRPTARRYTASATAATLSARHRRSTYRHLNPAYQSSLYYSLRLPYRYSYGHMRPYNSGTVYRGYYGSLSNWPYGGLSGRDQLRYRPLFSSNLRYSYLRPYSSIYGPLYPYDLAYFTYPRASVYSYYVPRGDWNAAAWGAAYSGRWSDRGNYAPINAAPILCSRPYYAYYYPTCCVPCCPAVESQRATKPEPAPEAAVPESGKPRQPTPQKLAPHPESRQLPDSAQPAPQPAPQPDVRPLETLKPARPADTGPRLSLSPVVVADAAVSQTAGPRLTGGRIAVFRPTVMVSPSALKPRLVVPERAAR